MSVSPFLVLELEAVKFIASAPRRLAAISKLVRVLVEFSKKAFTVVLRNGNDIVSIEITV